MNDMDANEVRFPWEDPEDAVAQPAPDRPATAGKDGPLAGATHADVAGEPAAADSADDPWSGSDTAGADDLEPWAHSSGADTSSPEADAETRTSPAATEGGAGARDRTIAHKEYYSISEVCELVDLKPHVLRYWETQFAVLNPSKNRSGNRVYQRKEIKLIQLVKNLLYDEKYTVEGAKQKLDQLRRGGELPAATGRALDSQTLDMLRTELRRLAELLTPPEPA
jgi:DNA-binding transcriptional MerR regulator